MVVLDHLGHLAAKISYIISKYQNFIHVFGKTKTITTVHNIFKDILVFMCADI